VRCAKSSSACALDLEEALLLANHGPVVSGATLAEAVHASEELEEAARLALLLRDVPGVRRLTPAQVDDLLRTFG
jgi:ribulose-5-phosphate 4-epimerase/fuculose-1-phosphate aldolase